MGGRIVAICALLAALSAGTINVPGRAQAQDEAEPPMVALLALVPHGAHGDLYFTDSRAIEQAYPPARMPVSVRQYNQSRAQERGIDALWLPLDVWRQVNFNFVYGLSVPLLDEIQAAMGIDFFQIERFFVNNAAPNSLLYLDGAFDLEQVRSALTARGFAQQAANPELWCGAVGCENSHEVSIERRMPADMFGGDLGREWARLLLPDRLIGANFYADLLAVSEALAGERRTLAQNDAYQAALAALADQGVLLQALIPYSRFAADLYARLPVDVRLNMEQTRIVAQRMLDEGYETLPPFTAALMADTVSETEQLAHVVLVYQREADAQTAARIIPQRILSYQSARYRRPLMELLQERRAAPRIEVLELNGRAVVRLTLATQKATPQEIIQLVPPTLLSDDLPDVTAPGMLYRLLVQSMYNSDLGWLSLAPRQTLEALVEN